MRTLRPPLLIHSIMLLLPFVAFALKYRLTREENSPYSLDKHPREDAYRAMRLVRSRAAEWHIAPNRMGMMGFSAGGEVVAMVAYASCEGAANSHIYAQGRHAFHMGGARS